MTPATKRADANREQTANKKTPADMPKVLHRMPTLRPREFTILYGPSWAHNLAAMELLQRRGPRRHGATVVIASWPESWERWKMKNHRPDVIVVDQYETFDEEKIRGIVERTKADAVILDELHHKAALPAMARLAEGGCAIVVMPAIGTHLTTELATMIEHYGLPYCARIADAVECGRDGDRELA